MIVVATDDFRLYHEAVTALRDRGVTFTTIQPGEALPERTTVVITAPDDPVDFADDDLAETEIEHVTAEADEIRPAVETALSILRGEEGRTVIGVDPGTRPGVAVLVGGTVVAAFQVPLADVIEVIDRETADADDPLVRIGDGARLQGTRIVNDLEDVAVEIVDETGTTPYLGTGARGMGDVLAAVNIARREGEPVDSREIEPTPGEIQRIKTRSREQSAGDRTIPETLARKVAVGELTVDEALAAHRAANGNATAADTPAANTDVPDTADADPTTTDADDSGS
ncbi:MAG: hypothetical protein ACOC0Z_05845 [Halohasta sp.]